jgi:hypothetical protein
MVIPSSDISPSVPTAFTRGGGRGSSSNTHGRRSTRTRGTTTTTSTGTGGTLKAAAAYTTGLGNATKFTKSPRSSTGRNIVGGKHGSIGGSNNSITNRDGSIERVVRKWVRVDRAPVGTTFTIRLWVPRDQLTPEERIRYNCHDVVVPMVLGNEEMLIVTDEQQQQQPNWVVLSEELQTTTTATTTSSSMETVTATTILSRHNSVTFASDPPNSASLLNEPDLVNSIPETETSDEQQSSNDVVGAVPITSLPDLYSDAMDDLPIIPSAADPAPLISSTANTLPIQDFVNVTTIGNVDEGHSTSLHVCEATQPIVDDIAGNGEMDVTNMTTELPSQIVAEESIDDIDPERAAKRPRYE